MDNQTPTNPEAGLLPCPQEWCAGFLFLKDRDLVVLLRKAKPEWQRGKLNAVGGKVEAGETALEAMHREWSEEARAPRQDWRPFCTYDWKGGRVHFFTAETPIQFGVCDIGPEPCHWRDIWAVTCPAETSVIANLKWLIPLARDKDATFVNAKEPDAWNTRPTPSQDREAALREALVICEADRLKLLGDGFFEDATSKIVSAALSTHPKQPSQGTVERLKKIKALALYAVGDGNDCQCGADDSPNEAVDECWWHEVLRHTNELLASSSSLTRTEPSQDATRLDGAIRWALGETDEFPERKETDGAYWWRSELRKRAFDSQGQKP